MAAVEGEVEVRPIFRKAITPAVWKEPRTRILSQGICFRFNFCRHMSRKTKGNKETAATKKRAEAVHKGGISLITIFVLTNEEPCKKVEARTSKKYCF
jgi:hypothetical protein